MRSALSRGCLFRNPRGVKRLLHKRVVGRSAALGQGIIKQGCRKNGSRRGRERSVPQTRQRFYRHCGLRVAQQGIPFGKNVVPKSGHDLTSQEFDRSPNGQHHPFELRLGVRGETRAEVAARRQGHINSESSLASTGKQNFLGGRQRRRKCGRTPLYVCQALLD